MKTRHLTLRLAVIVGACSTLSACLSSTPAWDHAFGNAVKQITALQTLNPDAAANTDTVAGVDGTAATAAQQNYGKSFMTPQPPTNVFTIGVSGGSGGGSGN